MNLQPALACRTPGWKTPPSIQQGREGGQQPPPAGIVTDTEQNADFYTETSRLIRAGEFAAAARRMDSPEFDALPVEVQKDLHAHYRERLGAIGRA